MASDTPPPLHVFDLPVGILLHAASYLSHVDLTRLAYSSRRMLPIAFSEQAWAHVFVRLNRATPLPADAQKGTGFRARCHALKRAKDYKTALSMGRVGRLAGPKVDVVLYLATDELEAGEIHPKRWVLMKEKGEEASASAAAAAAVLEDPFARLKLGKPATTSEAGGAGAAERSMQPVALRQGTASWSALLRP